MGWLCTVPEPRDASETVNGLEVRVLPPPETRDRLLMLKMVRLILRTLFGARIHSGTNRVAGFVFLNTPTQRQTPTDEGTPENPIKIAYHVTENDH